MELKVKERLTGAVILVALIVLLVPELLSGPSSATPSATRRPDEPPMRSYTINLAEGGLRQTATPASAVPKPVVREELSAVLRPPIAPQASSESVTPSAPAVEKSTVQQPAAPPVRIRAPEPSPVTGWSIQLGSFVSRDNAQRLVRELKSKGFTAFIAEGGSKRGKLYRVRVGPAADRAAAAALATKLRSAGQPGSVVPYP